MNNEHPRNCDILFGRGPDCWNHAGNKQFRLTVAKYHETYHSMHCRSEKVKLVAGIVQEIRSSGARFMRRNTQSNQWEEVDRKTTIEKVRRTRMWLFCTMVENPYLRPNLSVGRNNGVNVQIGDFMSSSSDTTSFDDYQQLSAFPDGDHSTINQNLMPGFNPHRVNLLYQSYLQQYSQSIGDTTLSIPLHWHHLFDNLHNNALRSRLLGHTTNSFLRPANLEPQILSMILRQKAIADALRFSC
jgi:hypothetical protein